jgi:hypothetical protein
MSNVKSQAKQEIDQDEIFKLLEQTCKLMLPNSDKEELMRLNISIDCFCNAQAEAGMKILSTMDYEDMNMEKYLKFIQDMSDETSPLHNEYVNNFTVLFEKNCIKTFSSVSVEGPQKGVVPLSKYGTMYKIKVTTGKSEKYFIMDTGADNCFLTKSYARELEDMNLIQQKDYIESAEYQDAHGKTVLHKRVLLNNVKIGDFTLNNVIFAIANNDAGGLLLGKDILDAFQSWNINNNNSTLELVK